jgi:hypothetical protein
MVHYTQANASARDHAFDSRTEADGRALPICLDVDARDAIGGRLFLDILRLIFWALDRGGDRFLVLNRTTSDPHRDRAGP